MLPSLKKRFFAALLSLILFALSAQTAFASEAVSFSCEDVKCAYNRLFYVEVKAQCSQGLSAAAFEFTYDDSLIEFRGASSDDSGASISSADSDGSVRIIYLYEDGRDVQNETVIFKLKFKSVGVGSGYISFSASDCVDGDAEKIASDICADVLVTVSSSSSSSASSSSKASSSGSSSSSSSKSSASSSAKSSGTSRTSSSSGSGGEDSEESYDDFGVFNFTGSDNEYLMLVIGMLFGFCVIMVFLFAFLLGQRVSFARDREKTPKKKPPSTYGGGGSSDFRDAKFSAYENPQINEPEGEIEEENIDESNDDLFGM